MNVELATGAHVTLSSSYPPDRNVQQAISEVYNSYGVMTYCKKKTLRKFGSTINADSGSDTTLATMYNNEINETYSTTNDIDYIVSSDSNDTMEITIEGHYYDSTNRKIFTVQHVTLNGQTPVALNTVLCRATRYKVKKQSFGNEPSNVVGNISVYVSSGTTVSNGVIDVSDDTAVKLYGVATNQSSKCASSTSYYDYFVIMSVGINAIKASGGTALIDYRVEYREEGGVWLPLGIEGSIRTSSQSSDKIGNDPYIGLIPRDSDFRMIVNSSANDIPVKGFINGFLLNDINDPNSTLNANTKAIIQQSIRASS